MCSYISSFIYDINKISYLSLFLVSLTRSLLIWLIFWPLLYQFSLSCFSIPLLYFSSDIITFFLLTLVLHCLVSKMAVLDFSLDFIFFLLFLHVYSVYQFPLSTAFALYHILMFFFLLLLSFSSKYFKFLSHLLG